MSRFKAGDFVTISRDFPLKGFKAGDRLKILGSPDKGTWLVECACDSRASAAPKWSTLMDESEMKSLDNYSSSEPTMNSEAAQKIEKAAFITDLQEIEKALADSVDGEFRTIKYPSETGTLSKAQIRSAVKVVSESRSVEGISDKDELSWPTTHEVATPSPLPEVPLPPVIAGWENFEHYWTGKGITGKDETPVGTKNDEGKPRAGLVLEGFALALKGVVESGTLGAIEYGDDNWLIVPNAKKRFRDAMMRHYLEYARGVKVDPKSGISHFKHFVWNALAVLHFEMEEENQ